MQINKHRNKLINLPEILLFCGNLICLYFAYRWVKNNPDEYEPKIAITSLIIGLIVQLFLIPNRIFVFLNQRKLLREYSGDKISIDFLNSKFPHIPKISIVGIGNVGKSTLIENICDQENLNTLTTGIGAYINNFSKKSYKYAAMLDASGQSQAVQNDIAIQSDILIILLDHNQSGTSTYINQDRLEQHKIFLHLLKDRLTSQRHHPNWIHFLLNKQDLWIHNTTSDVTALEDFFKDSIMPFVNYHIGNTITFSNYSNQRPNDCSRLIKAISNNL